MVTSSEEVTVSNTENHFFEDLLNSTVLKLVRLTLSVFNSTDAFQAKQFVKMSLNFRFWIHSFILAKIDKVLEYNIIKYLENCLQLIEYVVLCETTILVKMKF